jgi:hypothetical protein
MLAGSLGILLFAIVFLPLCVAALTHNISAAYLGENLSATESYRRAAPRVGSLILTMLVVGIICGIGFVLCVVPGIIFYCWFFVTVPVVILEGRGVSDAMSRSRNLTQGNMLKVFLVWIVLVLLGLVFAGIMQVTIRFVPGPQWLKMFFASILNAFILPIQAAPQVLMYYDLRIRKEAFDLQMLASALHEPTTA